VVFSLGYIYEAIHKTLYIGTLISDLGTDIQYAAEPLNANLAGSLHLRNFLTKQDQNILAVDTIGYIDTGFGFKIGDEYKLNFDKNAVALRLGFRTGVGIEVSNVTAGVGLYHSFEDFDGSLDYAFVPYGVLGETHRVSLNIIIGGRPIPPQVYLNSAAFFVLGKDSVMMDIAYVNAEPASRWKVTILDASGVLVRGFWGKGTPPEHYQWDGKDQNGKLVPQGNYSMSAEVTDDDGNIGRSNPHPVFAQWVPKKVPYEYTYGFSGDLLFDSGKADLLMRGYQAIQKAAAAIQAKYPSAAIQIAGHTDNVRLVPNAKFKDNQELSLGRAQSVLDFLVKSGTDINKLSVIGYGDTKPIASNKTPEGRAQNRRVELVVSGSVEIGSDELIAEGRKLMEKKYYKEALQVFLKAVEANSRDAKAYRYAGDCYLILGDKDQAVQSYVKSIEYDPTNMDLKNWLNQYAPGSIPTPVPIRIQTGDETPTPQAQTGGGAQESPVLPGMPGF
jgi:outer membrane protein OmpA-like peptidoglycan-associated protein